MRNKLWIPGMLVLALLIVCGCASAEGGWREAELPVWRGEPTEETAVLRYFDDAPEIPCIGFTAYCRLVLGENMTCVPGDEGCAVLRAASGALAVADPARGTLTVPDWPSFRNDLTPAREGRQGSFLDGGAGFVRVASVVYEGDPKPVCFDLARYGLPLHTDGDEVWMPLSVTASMMTDVSIRYAVTNGRAVYVMAYESPLSVDPYYFDTPYFNGGVRSEALAEAAYGELCFAMDYLYGCPGVIPIEEDLRARGFDAALSAAGEEGARVRELLHAASFSEYLSGANLLSTRLTMDGHSFLGHSLDLFQGEMYMRRRELMMDVLASYTDLISALRARYHYDVKAVLERRRREAWGPGARHIFGDTLVLTLPDFNVDTEAWQAYYAGRAPLPEDSVGLTARALEEAASHPEIRHFVFDVSTNGGGYDDALAAIIALATGSLTQPGEDVLSGQPFRITYEVDRNFDGVFDKRDAEVRYDFDYAVLTSRVSFSCGNLFPVLMRHEGARILGEPSGGGGCVIAKCFSSEGLDFTISSHMWRFRDTDGGLVEDGAPVDVAFSAEDADFYDLSHFRALPDAA
ncbi:MAG: hypothetical protein IKH38_04610 [Clostridia bacterium]|nr:hypothetical protein [Clostridia bacterium]